METFLPTVSSYYTHIYTSIRPCCIYEYVNYPFEDQFTDSLYHVRGISMLSAKIRERRKQVTARYMYRLTTLFYNLTIE